MKQALSPVALFVYNRPQHTRRVLDALAGDRLADRTHLYIFSDAARDESQSQRVAEVRSLVAAVPGFASVRLIQREENLGLARSIISGVTLLCTEHGRAIVLEDDLLVSPHFLSYMNAALKRYAVEDRVLQVSGSMFPIPDPDCLPASFFSRLPASWGWATWARAWARFDADAKTLHEQLRRRGLEYEFDMLGSYPYSQMLREQAQGHIDSWAVRWYASMFLAEGLCLRPSRSLVNNIGFDGSGVHCGTSSAFEVTPSDQPIEEFPDIMAEHPGGLQAIARFYRSLRPSVGARLAYRLRSWLAASLVRRIGPTG